LTVNLKHYTTMDYIGQRNNAEH